MRSLRINWRPLLVLGLLLGLMLYFHTFLITNIFEPITLLFWVLWRIVMSVHQSVYWAVLILAGSILLVCSIPFKRKPASPAYGDDYSPVDRVEHWSTLLKIASFGTDKT